MKNPFLQKSFNLTEQAELYKKDFVLAEHLKAEASYQDEIEERKMFCTQLEFNLMDSADKARFIAKGGEVG